MIRICKAIKEAGGIPRIHSHGKIRKVLDQFALTEADAIDPIEPIPDGDIDLADVKNYMVKGSASLATSSLRNWSIPAGKG